MNRFQRIGRREQDQRESEAFHGSGDARPCQCGHGMMKHEFYDFGVLGACSQCSCLVYLEGHAVAELVSDLSPVEIRGFSQRPVVAMRDEAGEALIDYRCSVCALTVWMNAEMLPKLDAGAKIICVPCVLQVLTEESGLCQTRR